MKFARAPLEVLTFLLLGVPSGSFEHTLLYKYMLVSEPGEGLPQFITVGYLNNQIITYYDSQNKKKVPKVDWMRQVENEDVNYWKEGSFILHETQQVLQEDLRQVQNRYKQNGGFHTWQLMYGCALQRDESKRGLMQYGYDGRTFISFDKETLTWVAPVPQAQVTQRSWDANVQWSQRNKEYLEEECIKWLEKYLSYGQETLLRTETPVVTMSSRMESEDGMETHICKIHGFYPREIDASWTRDGEVWLEETFQGFVAPNSDGTYHYWLSIRIDPKERGRYRCHVEHDSLQEPLDVAIKEPTNSKSNLGLIIGCVVAALVLACPIAGILVLFFKKYEDGYKAGKTSDKGANNWSWGRTRPFSSFGLLTAPVDHPA